MQATETETCGQCERPAEDGELCDRCRREYYTEYNQHLAETAERGE